MLHARPHLAHTKPRPCKTRRHDTRGVPYARDPTFARTAPPLCDTYGVSDVDVFRLTDPLMLPSVRYATRTYCVSYREVCPHPRTPPCKTRQTTAWVSYSQIICNGSLQPQPSPCQRSRLPQWARWESICRRDNNRRAFPCKLLPCIDEYSTAVVGDHTERGGLYTRHSLWDTSYAHD
jgi:hypothetical protein